MSTQQMPEEKPRDWYSVSVVSVQRVTTLIGLVIFTIVAFFGYGRWLAYSMEDRALALIEHADRMLPELEKRDDIEAQRKKQARDLQAETKAAFNEGDFERALERGQTCVVMIEGLLGEGTGSIRVVRVQGGVEYRRGERGTWKRLRLRDSLNPGDWVKTDDDGTAQLLFNETSSQFTLRQATLVHLGSALGTGNDSTQLETGQLELATSDKGSTVATPKSFAEVRGETEALVSFDSRRQAAQFAAYEGTMEVRSKGSGVVRQLSALQQVSQIGDDLSDVRGLPGQPTLTGPAHDHSIDLEKDKELVLSWDPVRRAQQYQLRIATTQLFANNLIDDQRTKTSARVGLRGEGNFYWQVAAVDSSGAAGPWSEPRAFRVASLGAIADVGDRTPPKLEILGTTVLGANVIVNGQTEPGATVTINGKKISIKPDGSFESTVEFKTVGRVELVIVAKDAWNNPTEERKTVFIDESL